MTDLTPTAPSSRLEGALSAASSRARFLRAAFVIVAVQVLVASLGCFGMAVDNIARAYVTGEAQYSKAQKEAVISLMRFTDGRDPADYAAFATALKVLKGDHAARTALEAERPDLAAAAAGFLAGGNARADVPALINGYRFGHAAPEFADAVSDWRQADGLYGRLEALALRLRAQPPRTPIAAADRAEIDRIDAAMTALEQRFSGHMGLLARRASMAAFAAVTLLSVVFCAMGVAASWQVQQLSARLVRRLADARDKAEAAVEARTQFLANMSHEIRTPLTGIVGFARLLGDTADLPAAARSNVARITTASQTLLSVVNDILDFSKIEAGQIELDPQPFDPRAFLAETLELVERQAEAKGLRLDGAFLSEVPAAVLADDTRVRQVLLNLLTNAIKFTAEGCVKVEAWWDGAAARLRFEVHDTGVGISADAQARLFQRFSQADSSISRQHGGTGLGLAISKRLVELMQGEIGLESDAGEGSTFWFEVAAPQTEAQLDAPGADDVAATAPARILIVDDLAQNRELVAAILSPFDHDLTEAASGAEAVERAIAQPFDLILMDLQMPGMDGLAATKAIRATAEANRATPIIALSANVLSDHVQASLAAGMDDHIGKPIDIAELLSKVAEWTAPDRTHDAAQALSAAAS